MRSASKYPGDKGYVEEIEFKLCDIIVEAAARLSKANEQLAAAPHERRAVLLLWQYEITDDVAWITKVLEKLERKSFPYVSEIWLMTPHWTMAYPISLS